MFEGWMGRGWAQPVVSRRWAVICSVACAIKKASGYRLLAGFSHSAWARACGLPTKVEA